MPAATVTVGGIAATNVVVVSGTQITAMTPMASKAGAVDVIVTNPSGRKATASKGYFYSYASVTFAPMVTYTARTGPSGIASGDVSGDGKLDLAVANYNSGTVSIYLGNGDGSFGNQVTYTVGSLPEFLALSDLNADSKLDLVVPNRGGNTVSILLGNGDGTFKTPATYAIGSLAATVTIGDFNADGKPDIASGNNGSGNVSVLLGNGDGTFNPQVTYTDSNTWGIASGDFTGDGKIDILTGSGGGLGALLGNGDGTFQSVKLLTEPYGPLLLLSADINGDKKLDLVASDTTGSAVGIILGNGDGTFIPATKISTGTGSGPFGLAVADLDHDGNVDVVSGNSNSTVSVLMGKGGGAFTVLPSISTAAKTSGVTVADFNGDGAPDIAAARDGANSIAVFLSTAK